MNKKRAVAYCRVSTDKEDQLNSLEAQREYFQNNVANYGFELVHIYADEGITGTKKKNRKAFLQMLEDARERKFEVLFVKDISRFARNTLDSLESVRLLKKLSINIVFINNQGILENGSELMFTILSAMAQEESVNTSKRVKFGKLQNMKKGKVPNLVYGYDKIPGEYFSLHINEAEANIVRNIFNTYVYEGAGCLSIAQYLNNSGIRTKRGALWSQNAISRIIKNPIYIGQITNGRESTKEIYSNARIQNKKEDWIITLNEDLRIIPDDLYEQAQKILAKRYDAFHMSRERQSNKYVFSTLIKCKCCGRSFRRIVRHYSNTYIRWTCSSRNSNGIEACPNATLISEEELLEEIKQYILQWKKDKTVIVSQALKEYQQICAADHFNAPEELQKELYKLEQKKERLKDMYLNDIISMDELKNKSDELNQQINHIQIQLREDAHYLTNDKLEQLLSALFENMDHILSADTITNEMLKQIIDRIEVDETGQVDVIIKPIQKIHLGVTVPLCDGST